MANRYYTNNHHHYHYATPPTQQQAGESKTKTQQPESTENTTAGFVLGSLITFFVLAACSK
jgi:hypothetical protein